MDTLDILILGAFVLLLLPIVTRLTFWKQNGQLLHVWPSVIPVLLFAIAAPRSARFTTGTRLIAASTSMS